MTNQHTAHMNDQRSAQVLQGLQARQADANKKIIQYQAEHKSITDQLNAAWAEVYEKYGVNNLDELRNLYNAKNEEKNITLANAEKELIEIEQILSVIDQEITNINKV